MYSTLNMLSLLVKEEYDISVFAMSHQGPVKNTYSKYHIEEEKFWISLISGATNKERGIKLYLSFFVKLLIRALKKINIDIKQYVYTKTAQQLTRYGMYDYVVACQEGLATHFVSTFQNVKKIAWVRCEYSSYINMVPCSQYQKEQYSIYPQFNKIVCVSETTRNDFVHFFGHLKDRVFAIHNIQDIDSISDKSNETVNDNFSPDYFNIVSIGRIAPQKRFNKIPEIANSLRKQGVIFKWYIIGDGNIEGEGDKLREAINLYHCEDCVICLGYKQNPYPYIKAAALLVNTSYTEACPRVIAEAQILGTPTVCTNFSSAKEFIKDGVNGYIGSLEDLPSIIGELIRSREMYGKIKEAIYNNTLVYENNRIMIQLKELFV